MVVGESAGLLFPRTDICPQDSGVPSSHHPQPDVSPFAHPIGPQSLCLKWQTALCVGKCGFGSCPHGLPSLPLRCHPPPWAPKIGTAASSSFWLPSPKNSGATMGQGLSGEHRHQPDVGPAPPPPTLPSRPHTEDFNRSLRLGCHLSGAECMCPREDETLRRRNGHPGPPV